MRVLLFMALLSLPTICFANEVAITIDDVPLGDTSIMTGEERTKKIIQSLKDVKSPPIGIFAVGSYIKKRGTERVYAYAHANHVVCNHSYSHSDLGKVPADEYIEDIHKADLILNKIPNFQKFFRFPYLSARDDIKRRAVLKYLQQNGYREGYVTTNTSDYLLNKYLLDAVREKKKINYKKLKQLFLEHVLECLVYHDKLMTLAFGRKIKHTLLVHENDIVAICMKDLIKFLRKNNWKVISVNEAYEDFLFNTEEQKEYDMGSFLRHQGKNAVFNTMEDCPKSLYKGALKERFKSMEIAH